MQDESTLCFQLEKDYKFNDAKHPKPVQPQASQKATKTCCQPAWDPNSLVISPFQKSTTMNGHGPW